MTPERWAQVKSIVADALELPESERGEFVDRACAADTELRREVESLLVASAGDDSITGARAAVASAAILASAEYDASQRDALIQAIGGQYDVLRLIGRGATGAVYLARELALDRFVAIKVLRPDIVLDEQRRDRFRREARIVAQLSHPGIIPLHSFGDSADLLYFVMGYARGETLADRLRVAGRVPWVEAHRILVELTDAVAAGHKHGVIHRDIKPANILLDEESGHTRLADFSIAKVVGLDDDHDIGGRFAIVGTPGYMSPEQAMGHAVDERTDIYSIGVVGYAILSGRDPFVAPSVEAVMRMMVTEDPSPLKSVAPNVPDDLADVVMKCLARDRDARWRDARELKQALVRAAETASAPLPEQVRDLPSFGAYAVLWATAWSVFALMSGHEPSERLLLLLIAFLVPLGLGIHVWNFGRHRLRPAELARVAAWPPEWWGMWWPRSLRRPTDLWPRLPVIARVVRVTLSMVFLLVPVLIALRQWLQTRRVGEGRVDWQWFLVVEGVVVAIAGIVVIVALEWTRRRGLSGGETARLLFGATADSSSWRTPALARLLTPLADEKRD